MAGRRGLGDGIVLVEESCEGRRSEGCRACLGEVVRKLLIPAGKEQVL